MVMPQGTFPLTLVSILHVLLSVFFLLPWSFASQFDVLGQHLYNCPYPGSLNKTQHERFLDGLNGTRIVFIGDSLTRDSNRRIQEYTHLYYENGWNEYYLDSSSELNTPVSVEVCFCELNMKTWSRTEQRSFIYRDEQINLNPTHILLNYGLWMRDSDRDCGQRPGDICPMTEEVCEFLNGEHPFRVIWQTTTPTWWIGKTLIDHHLHIVAACNLDPSMVLHRALVVKALSLSLEDVLVDEWHELFHDMKHFTAPPYHAFNGALLDMIIRGDNSTSEGVGQEEQAAQDQQTAFSATDIASRMAAR